MKKLLFVLTFLMILSCTNEDDTPPPPELDYTITIREDCPMSALTRTFEHCVTKAEYKMVREFLDGFPTGNDTECEWEITFKDKGGVERNGWFREAKEGQNICD